MKLRMIDQPAGGTVGARLQKYLSDAAGGAYQEIFLVAAFAKRAGISRIALELAAARGAGCNITAIIGIDHGGTSREGFEDVVNACDTVFVVHSTNRQVTFHSKAYLFRGTSTALLISGSSNLTAGGLFTNIELCTQMKFDLPVDAKKLSAATSWIVGLQNDTNDYVVRVNVSNKATICAMLPPEQFAASTASGVVSSGPINNLFGAGNFPAPPPLPQKTPAPSAAQPASAIATVSASPLLASGGWKKLSKFDVHPRQSPGSMQIPIALWPLFPVFTNTVITSAGVAQPEVSFPARYIDGPAQKLGSRRLIEYPPAVGHSRPNIERRLAFHDRAINPNGLKAGDVLVFEPLQNDPAGALMNIIRIRPADPRYGGFPGLSKKSAHGLLP